MSPTRSSIPAFGHVRPPRRAACFFSGWAWLVFASLPFWLNAAAVALSPDDVLTVRITAEVEGNGAVARKLAQDQAEVMAMEEVIRSWVPDMDPQPYRGLLRHARAYVRQTDVLRTTRDGNRLRLEADVTLRELPLRRDLAAALLPRLPEKPAYALITGPVEIAGSIPLSSTEHLLDPAVRRLVETLGQLGFSGVLADRAEPFSARVIETAFQEGVESLGKLARQARQPFLLACDGSVRVQPVHPDSNVLREEAVFNIRLFRTEDGKMLDSLGMTSVVQSVDPAEGAKLALEDAAAKLTTDCVAALTLSSAASRREDPDAVVVLIEQPPDATAVETVAAVLRELPETQAVEILSTGPALARIRIRAALRMVELADLLQQMEAGNYRLDLRKAFGREIQVVLVRR